MNQNQQLLIAIRIALDAHGDQLDKAGKPYILHPLHVMSSVDSIDAKIVAVLHDVIEDTNTTLEGIRYALSSYGWFNVNKWIDALDAISKRKGENYTDYLTRVKANPLALQVKLADIEHNLSESRLALLSKEEAVYLRTKYQKALEFLNA